MTASLRFETESGPRTPAGPLRTVWASARARALADPSRVAHNADALALDALDRLRAGNAPEAARLFEEVRRLGQPSPRSSKR